MHGKTRSFFGTGRCPAAAPAAAGDHARLLLLAGRARRSGSRFLLRGRLRPVDRVRLVRELHRRCSSDPDYYQALVNTAIFSTVVCVLSLSIALLLAVMADRQIRGADDLQDPADLALRGGARRRRRAVDLHVRALARHAGARPARASASTGTRCSTATHAMTAGRPRRDLEADQLQFPVLPGRPAGDPQERDRGGGDRRRAAAAPVLDDHLPAAVADHLLPARRQHRLRVLRHLRHHRRDDRRRARRAHRDAGLQGLCRRHGSAAISAARRRNR